jgi:NAD+ synthase (glutamine-hydrolysing)
VIPERVFTRPPSAELRAEQVDPFDYARIGPLADLAVEEHLSAEQLIARGYTPDEVALVLGLVRQSEYKRRQAPPILRVTHKAFGPGRRMPIVNHYKSG